MEEEEEEGAVQLCCSALRVRFGVMDSKYNAYPWRPKLSFVVDTSPSLCQILDACDEKAQQLSVESGSNSEWNPVVFRKDGCFPTVRLHIPFVDVDGPDGPRFETEIYRKKSYGAVEELKFSKVDELIALINEGTFVDAYFSLNHYDYLQKAAGIRLVAKKLFIHPN
ncbi:hypothetical protein CRG98_050214 [Punica granatum]|nr:hypothetical protein CRG98_050214 [Punica granatum]